MQRGLNITEYLEKSNMAKTPIMIESRPWGILNEDQRKSSFKVLQVCQPFYFAVMLLRGQDYDREQTLKQKIAEAGSEADTKAIYKQLFGSDELPNRWRSWSHLLKREREGQFKKLQVIVQKSLQHST